jgi:hypothetical protein
VKVDIHAIGQPNGHAPVTTQSSQTSSGSAARAPASSAKAAYANGTVSKGAPARGKPGAAKGAQKKDPAEVQRERQLAEEEEVRQSQTH